MIKKIFSALLLTILLVTQLILPLTASADGMLMRPDPYADRWDFSPETNQQAFINYEDGVQKMIISIGVEDQASRGAVWIFPVPSAPESVNIDVLAQVPDLRGEELSRKAEMVLDRVKSLVNSSQIYPFIFENLLYTTLLSDDGSDNLGSFGTKGLRDDVEVYEHIEKDGIVSEVITAKTADGLYNYFKNKGLNVEIGSISVLDNYIGKDYSFIASWISVPVAVPNDSLTASAIEQNLYKYITESDTYWRFSDYYNDYIIRHIENHISVSLIESMEWNYLKDVITDPAEAVKYFTSTETKYGKEYLDKIIKAIQRNPSLINEYIKQEVATNQKGVYVTFPAEKMYFPLIPTSVYGDIVVPASIRVLGHVSPEIYNNIKDDTTVKYYSQDYFSTDKSLSDFFGKIISGARISGESLYLSDSINYTKIDIGSPSKFFTEDLWIKNVPPLEVVLPNFIIEQKWLIYLIMLIIVSVFIGVLSGLVIFSEYRNMKGVKKFGLLGLSNIFSIFGLAIAVKFIKTKEGSEEAEKILLEIKKRSYYKKVLISTFLFYLCLPFLFLSIFIFIPLLAYLIESIRYGMWSSDGVFFLFFVLVFIVFVISLKLKKIKTEEQLLVNQLKNYGYSTTTFTPEDDRKIGFVIFYSVSFLIISWILFKVLAMIM